MMCDAEDSFDDVLANIEIPPPQSSKVLLLEKNIAGVPVQTLPSNKQATSSNTTIKPSVNKANCILVNPKQRGNPLLKAISNISWEYDDSLVPDYVVGEYLTVVFISK